MSKIRITRSILIILFLVTIFSKVYGDLFIIYYKQNSIVTYFKQISVLVSVVIMLLYSLKYKFTLTKQFQPIIYFFYFVLIYSLIRIFLTSNFSMNFIKTTFYLIIPVLYCILIVSFLTELQVRFLFKISVIIILLFLIIFYANKGLSWKDLIAVNFIESESPFENEFISGISMSLFLYFNYFRKNNRFYLLISIILVLLSFKRLSIIYTLLLFFFNSFFNLKRELKPNKRKYKFFLGFATFILIIVSKFIYSAQGIIFLSEYLPNINADNFFMGRDIMLKNVLDGNFISYGFGSLEDYLGKLFEIEGLRIYFELGFVGAFIFSFIYWFISKDKIYLLIVSSYIYINIITSSMLADFVGFIIIYLTYFFINQNIEKKMVGKND